MPGQSRTLYYYANCFCYWNSFPLLFLLLFTLLTQLVYILDMEQSISVAVGKITSVDPGGSIRACLIIVTTGVLPL